MQADKPARYAIEVRPNASAQLSEILDWIRASSPANADLVFSLVIKRIDSLATMPFRFPRVQRRLRHKTEIRCFTESSLRVEYAIEGSTVIILYVEHTACDNRFL